MPPNLKTREKTPKTKVIEKLKKEHLKAFPKDFYLWSELGWWLQEVEKHLLEAYQLGREELIQEIRDGIEPGEDILKNYRKVLDILTQKKEGK